MSELECALEQYLFGELAQHGLRVTTSDMFGHHVMLGDYWLGSIDVGLSPDQVLLLLEVSFSRSGRSYLGHRRLHYMRQYELCVPELHQRLVADAIRAFTPEGADE